MKETIRKAGDIVYIFCRKNVKNINLRVKEEGVFVSAPMSVPVRTADDFVKSKADFIRDAAQRLQKSRKEKEPHEYKDGDRCMFLGRELILSVKQGGEKNCLRGNVLNIYTADTSSFALRRNAVWSFYSEQAHEVFGKYLDKYIGLFKEYGVRVRKVTIKNMSSRWGSCTPSKGNISLNIRLMTTPEECIEYVILHEFCHFLEQNHSKNFYAFVAKYMPDWKEKREKLKEYSAVEI